MPPTVRLIIKDDKWEEILKEHKDLDGIQVESGLYGDGGAPDKNVAARGAVHEYGIPKGIRITDKMRNYLHFIGIHVRNDTKRIFIPSRPFMRSAFDNNLNENEAIIKKWYGDFLDNKIDLRKFLNKIGVLTSSQIKMSIKSGSYEPLHPVTKRLKGSSKPLLDSSVMMNSVKHKIVKKV